MLEKSREEGFYSKVTRQSLVEEGALSSEEEGFMNGYEEAFNEEEFTV